MKFTREIEQTIKKYLIDEIEEHSNDIVPHTMKHFDISRPTVSRMLQEMIEAGSIERKNPNKGRNPGYRLKTREFHNKHTLDSKAPLQEDKIYYDDIMPHVGDVPDNIVRILEYVSTEIINNAIEHSGGTTLYVSVKKNLKRVEVTIIDNGVGIFNKIQKDLGLQTPQQSILELCKGKFTSDPKGHTGEGIFFSSRMADNFTIISYGLVFNGHPGNDFTMKTAKDVDFTGTGVFFSVDMDTKRTAKEIFDVFADPDKESGFFKTWIPVKLMNIGGGQLFSRSQARRLMGRIERCMNAVLDFDGVVMIGQAFADEVFRVFQNQHPEVKLSTVNENPEVKNMIAYVKKSQE